MLFWNSVSWTELRLNLLNNLNSINLNWTQKISDRPEEALSYGASPFLLFVFSKGSGRSVCVSWLGNFSNYSFHRGGGFASFSPPRHYPSRQAGCHTLSLVQSPLPEWDHSYNLFHSYVNFSVFLCVSRPQFSSKPVFEQKFFPP